MTTSKQWLSITIRNRDLFAVISLLPMFSPWSLSEVIHEVVCTICFCTLKIAGGQPSLSFQESCNAFLERAAPATFCKAECLDLSTWLWNTDGLLFFRTIRKTRGGRALEEFDLFVVEVSGVSLPGLHPSDRCIPYLLLTVLVLLFCCISVDLAWHSVLPVIVSQAYKSHS